MARTVGMGRDKSLKEIRKDKLDRYYKENKLANTRCVVIGPMEGDRASGASVRDTVSECLTEFNIHVLDHYKSPVESSLDEGDDELHEKLLNYKQKEDWEAIYNMRQIRSNDLALIDKCDFIICHLDMNSMGCGTYEELFTANRAKKPIFVYCNQGLKKIPLWLRWTLKPHCFYETLDDVLDCITKLNSGDVEFDPDEFKLLKKEFR